MQALRIGAALAVLSIAGNAAAAVDSYCPAGSNVVEIRVSKIRPGGSLAGLRKAFADHTRWYAAHGSKDRFALEPVLSLDRARGALVAAPDQMITVHYRSGGREPSHVGDAAWAAFVAEYKANSDIQSETITCLPG